MAADGMSELKLQIVHAQEKHNIVLKLGACEGGEILTVEHLAEEVERVTGVLKPAQRLIFKGKSLKCGTDSLSLMGITNGVKIMLIGKKFSLEDDSNMKTMAEIESKLTRVEGKMSEVVYEVDGIQRGFLAVDLRGAALDKLSRRLSVCTEEFTRLLEQLDSLQLTETASKIRNRRKTLVQKIQNCLSQCDGVQVGIRDMNAGVQL